MTEACYSQRGGQSDIADTPQSVILHQIRDVKNFTPVEGIRSAFALQPRSTAVYSALPCQVQPILPLSTVTPWCLSFSDSRYSGCPIDIPEKRSDWPFGVVHLTQEDAVRWKYQGNLGRKRD